MTCSLKYLNVVTLEVDRHTPNPNTLNTMPEEVSHFLDSILAVVLGVFGWIVKKFADRLDKDEDRLTKIEVELAAQHERDVSVERRMAGLETQLAEMNAKLDRLLELIVGKRGI